MRKIHISKIAEKQIGGIRISLGLYNKLDKVAKGQKVTIAEVIRGILEQTIDEVEFY